MSDVFFLVLSVLFLVLSLGLIRILEGLREDSK